MSITLAQWLKIQGAEVGDYFLCSQWPDGVHQISDMRDDSYRYETMNDTGYCQTYGTQIIEPADLQLYRMVNGELQRINRPYITCTTCGRSVQIEKADGWCCHFENGSYCPDCEAKRKAKSAIKESLTTEKIKISPCPRCKSKEIRIFESYRNSEDSRIIYVHCRACGRFSRLPFWREKLEGNDLWTDITDQYEVEG